MYNGFLLITLKGTNLINELRNPNFRLLASEFYTCQIIGLDAKQYHMEVRQMPLYGGTATFSRSMSGAAVSFSASDATLNRFGVRIGTAEVYRALSDVPQIEDSLIVNLDLPGGKFFMPLFVKLKPGFALDEPLRARIAAAIRNAYSPRHVPDRIIAVEEIPHTLTGKKMEVPVRRILMGAAPEKAANRNAMANPGAIDAIVAYAQSQSDFEFSPERRAEPAASPSRNTGASS